MEFSIERLAIRAYQKEDLDFLTNMLANPNVVRYIGNGATRNKEEAKRFLQWIFSAYEHNKALGLQLLIDKQAGLRIGHAGIVPQKIEGVDELEIGYWIDEPYWGKGYATEAASFFRDYATEKLGITRLIALVQTGNEGSRHVAEKIGMKAEKVIQLKGRDVIVYTCHHPK